jgi:cell division protein ZapA
MTEPARVNIKILDKDYQVACTAEERTALLDSAEFLNAKMKAIREGGRVVGLERIAVMAALNMANELIHSRGRGDDLETGAKARVKAMRERVEKALHTGRQLDL